MIPRSTWSSSGARETGPRGGRAVWPLGERDCVLLRNARVFLPCATHFVNGYRHRRRNARQASFTHTCLMRVYSSIE